MRVPVALHDLQKLICAGLFVFLFSLSDLIGYIICTEHYFHNTKLIISPFTTVPYILRTFFFKESSCVLPKF